MNTALNERSKIRQTAADGGEGLQIWSTAADILIKLQEMLTGVSSWAQNPGPSLYKGVHYEIRTVSQLELLFREIRTTYRGTPGILRDQEFGNLAHTGHAVSLGQ